MSKATKIINNRLKNFFIKLPIPSNKLKVLLLGLSSLLIG